MSITITVPNDDHVALRAMAKALEEIAVARGAPVQAASYPQVFKDCASQAIEEAVINGSITKQPEIDTTSQQCESLLKGYDELPPVHDSEQAPPTTDSTGTPWDERIHSVSKALNADGTWRLRRKPKDMEEAEWLAYVETVRDELSFPADREYELDHRDVTDKDVEAVQEALDKAERGEAIYYTSEEAEQKMEEFKESVRQRAEPAVTSEGDDFHVDAGVVTEQQVASFPPPPPVPNFEASLQKVTEQNKELLSSPKLNDMSFPQIMAFLTERHGRITSAQVDQIIADMGLEKITDLNTQPEHTGPFIARVKALLGE